MELDSNDKVIKHYTIADELIGFEYDDSDYCYVNNGHGDVAFVTDGTGAIVNTYSYTAYGTALICDEKVSNSFRYTGEYYDAESGLYYLRARYMNPATGTFTQEDTYQGNIYDALSLHKYLYAQDNPVSYKDPTGNDVSFVGLVTTVGSWAMETAGKIWAAAKALYWWQVGTIVTTTIGLYNQVKTMFTTSDGCEVVENYFGLVLTIIGMMHIDVGKWYKIVMAAIPIVADVIHLINNIIDEDWKKFRSNLWSLGIDVLALLFEILDIKFDEKWKKILEDNKLKRNRDQLNMIEIAKNLNSLGNVPDSLVDILLKYAQYFDCFDDVWIALFLKRY